MSGEVRVLLLPGSIQRVGWGHSLVPCQCTSRAKTTPIVRPPAGVMSKLIIEDDVTLATFLGGDFSRLRNYTYGISCPLPTVPP